MANVTNLKRLVKEDFAAEDQALVDRLSFSINPLIEQLSNAFNKNIDFQNMYRSGELYQANPDTFFIKPYDLKLEDLSEFEKKCKKLIAGQKKEQD